MKKVIILFGFLLITHLICAEAQLSYRFSYDEEDGIGHRFASYVTSLTQHWLLENITTSSIHNENNTEPLDHSQYYLLNYIRNKVIATTFSEHYLVSAYLSGEFDFGRNIKTNIAGLPYQYTLRDGLTSGVKARYQHSKFEVDFSLDYDVKNYTYEKEDSTEGQHTEVNVQGEFAAALALSKSLKTYVEIYHYNDLNASSRFDMSRIYSGLAFEKKLNHIHYLHIDAAAGYTDIDSLFPYCIRSEARLTSKFIHDWMLVTKFSYDAWTDRDIEDIYVGKYFIELVAQKNFSFTNNNVNNMQMSAAHYFLSDLTLLKTRVQLYVGKLKLSASYARYIGEDKPYDNRATGKISYPVFDNIRMSYTYHFQENNVLPRVNRHTCGIDFRF